MWSHTHVVQIWCKWDPNMMQLKSDDMQWEDPLPTSLPTLTLRSPHFTHTNPSWKKSKCSTASARSSRIRAKRWSQPSLIKQKRAGEGGGVAMWADRVVANALNGKCLWSDMTSRCDAAGNVMKRCCICDAKRMSSDADVMQRRRCSAHVS